MSKDSKQVGQPKEGERVDMPSRQAISIRSFVLPSPQQGGVVTSLDLSTREGRVKAFNAGSPGDIDLGPNGIAEVVVSDYLIYPDSGVDPDTGEIREFNRTVLIGRDGRIFRTTAAHGAQVIARALAMFSKEEWAAGIKFRVVQRMGKRGHVYHDIRVVE